MNKSISRKISAEYNEDLLKVMREELDGDFLELALGLFRDPLAFDIDAINVFLEEEKRWPSLIGLLINKPPEQLSSIAEKFVSRKLTVCSHSNFSR